MTCLGRGDGTPLTLGHTCLPEMDWHLITRESPDFSHGECQTKSERMSIPMTYELAYLEEIHADGSVKHTYIEPVEEEPIAKPLDPNDAPVYEAVEDFLSQLSIQPSVSLSIRDMSSL